MAINAGKTQQWKKDIAASVDLFNQWFIKFAPKTYRDTRLRTTEFVKEALTLTNDLRSITPEVLAEHPKVLPTLRMSTAPPLARDRLVGLAYANKNLVLVMEGGAIPPRLEKKVLGRELASICATIQQLLDRDIFPWLEGGGSPSETEKYRASTVIADRLCGAMADPIVRNAQEQRQLALIGAYLEGKGYKKKAPAGPIMDMEPGTFAFRVNVPVGSARKVNIPIDVMIQPKAPRKGKIPILIEAKSAGDFTNTNKRRKEEATKIHQLTATYGSGAKLVLFLCGYFDSGYLGYEAAEHIDWVWEHRIDDLMKLGI
ncbi:MAG: XamI family restriction endonuclease [Bryobacteraceae bacterium]